MDASDDADLVRLAGRLARFGGWSVELATGQTYWTAELFALFGYESAGGAPPVDVAIAMFPEDQREIIQAAFDRNVVDGVATDLESVIVDREGRRVRVRILGNPVRDESGQIVRVHGAIYDISEIVAERENRIAAQESLRRTLDYIPDFVFFIDESWRVTFANQATIDAAGLPAERLYSEPIWSLLPELASNALMPVYERAMVDRVSGTARGLFQQFGNWLEVTAHPLESGIAVFGRDVTKDEEWRRKVDEISAFSHEQAAFLDASNEAMIMEDLDNVVTYWNQGAEQIYGWTADEAVGRNIRELVYVDPMVFEGPAAALLRDGRWQGEMVQRTKDGRTVIIECRWQSVRDENGHPVKLFAVNSDITAQRHQQELQSRAQRMESLGTLAGGIAHDLNNVLTPLLMSVQLMRSHEPTLDHEALLEAMEVSVKRGADMIRQVLSFARGVDGVRAVIDLADVMHELSAVSLQTLPPSIAVTSHFEKIPAIVGDKTQVLQVLMNLVANARDSMEGGGTMTLSVGRQTMTEGDRRATTLEPGVYALITVEDSGAGMSAEVLDRIFEPFFTTKELGRGTGLGLASSLAIVESHGGAISAYSRLGVGSRFTVHLPVAGEVPVTTESVEQQSAAPEGSGELVLVVDDEPSIRNLVSMTLQAHGYRVVEASNGRDAIEVFERHADEVALVFTDMMMPIMDGAATVAHFREHRPDVPIIASTGLTASGGFVGMNTSTVRHFLSKPFTTDALLRTVNAAMHEAAESTSMPGDN